MNEVARETLVLDTMTQYYELFICLHVSPHICSSCTVAVT